MRLLENRAKGRTVLTQAVLSRRRVPGNGESGGAWGVTGLEGRGCLGSQHG